ncbi:MAG TPA: tetratricopeptide repeat protein [Vicinamibacterales bacterium]
MSADRDARRQVLAGAWRRRHPDRAETVRLLLEMRQFDAALESLRLIVETRPDQMAGAFEALAENRHSLQDLPAHGYDDEVAALLTVAKARLRTVPREEAARIARQILLVEPADPDVRWPAPLEAFVAEYAGTEAGHLAAVDIVAANVSRASLERLAAIARENAGTAIGAKALYSRGFHLAHNATELDERTRHDPTDRFLEVLAIVGELESGRYPDSEPVRTALKLVFGFSTYEPEFAPANVDRFVQAAEAFLAAHLEYRKPGDDPQAFFIADKLVPLYVRRGDDPVRAVDALFGRLESAAGNDPARLELIRDLRVRFYVFPHDWFGSESVLSDRMDELRTKARALLESTVRSSGQGASHRRALAELATLHFADGHPREARALYDEYVRTYPGSPYAWVAAMRAGLCAQQLGEEPAVTAARFRAAADRFGSSPLAVTPLRVLAGRAAEAAGDFAGALADYEAAFRAWPAPSSWMGALDPWPRRAAQNLGIERDAVQARIAELRRTVEASGGSVLERGRWLLAQGRHEEAIATLAPLIGAVPGPIPDEARTLSHRARLERALDALDIEHPRGSRASALRELDALGREPWTFGSTAAGITKATLAALEGRADEADALMRTALDAWLNGDKGTSPVAARGPLERDAVAIRNTVFLPRGGGVYASRRWGATQFGAAAPFLIIDPDIPVRMRDGSDAVVSAFHPVPGHDNVLFLSSGRRALLERVMSALGGQKRHVPQSVMAVPNQPAGAAVDVRAFWSRYFHVRPGHWGGWIFETFPVLLGIDFADEALTKAAARVRIGYEGATVLLEKRDGAWVATGLTNEWIE